MVILIRNYIFMKRINKIKMLSSIILAAFATVSYAQPSFNFNEHARGRILVTPQAGLSAAEFDTILKEHGGKKHKLGQSNLHIVELDSVGSEEAIVAKLKKNPHVKFAELDRKVQVHMVPNDPYFGSEYHPTKVGANIAWDTTQGAGVTIAILDSGVDGTHPDLVPNLVPGYNFYDNNTDTSDVCGHGTAVAGTAAAVTNNGQGVSGIAGQAKIMPIRIAYFDSAAGSCYGYFSTITSGITYAADHGARIANVSYGSVATSSSILNAAQYMRSKGGLVFVSAGNSGALDSTAPTNLLTVVAATDQNDAKTSWSTYGDFVTLSAPGAGIYTTSRGGIYQQWNGTSFSSPLAAGVGALVMAANPKLTNTQVENILYTTAVDLGTVGRDQIFGYGRVNADAAVKAAVAVQSPPPDTTPPVVSITSPTASSTVSGSVSIGVNATDNVGVSSVELHVNGNVVAIDNSSPWGFSWDSKSVANGMVNLSLVAFDAAGNQASSSTVSVNVANATVTPPVADTTPPVVKIINPVAGSVSGNVNVNVNASDNSGAPGITQYLYIDSKLVKTTIGSTLAYSWNTRKLALGYHTLTAIAKDKAGNQARSDVQVKR
jgi:thermitase